MAKCRNKVTAVRVGFTLVELLVVIAIIGVLVALLLPAVQAAREAGRRAQCQNNFKQIGVATQNFHDAYKHFPLGGVGPWPKFDDYITGGKANGPLRQGLGWAYQLLPFLEQGVAQASAVGKTNPAQQGASIAISDIPIATYFCPSRRPPTRGSAVWALTGTPFWLIDYAAANAGPSRRQAQGTYPEAPDLPKNFDDMLNNPSSSANLAFLHWGCSSCGDSIQRKPQAHWGIVQRCDWDPAFKIHYGFTQKISFQQIEDGASNTLWASEKRLQPSEYLAGAGWDDRGWSDGWDYDSIRSTMFPIGPDIDDEDFRGKGYAWAFGAAHPAGVNAVFADSSVHFLAYEVDREAFNLLGNRADGEPLPDNLVK
jgi:prepilin-type N-terminal cleavage/methylation domain-containing protein